MNNTNITVSEEILKNELENFLRQVSRFFDKNIVEEIAKETGFEKRERKLTGLLFLSIFIFGLNKFGNPSLEQLVGFLKLYLPEIEVKRQSLHERINEEAVEFFKQILGLAIHLAVPNEAKLEVVNQFERVFFWDSTEFQLPEALAEYFVGKGGSASSAGIKVQFCYDFKAHQWFYILKSAVDSDKNMDSKIIEHTQAGDMTIHDLGYFKVDLFNGLDRKGVFYLSRLRTDANIYLRDTLGNFIAIDLIDLLIFRYFEERMEITVFIHSKHDVFTEVRLIVERLPQEAASRRLQKLYREAKSRGRQVSQRSIFLAQFNFYITNAPAEKLPTSSCRILYSIRWQIELVFKAWKSHLKLHKVLVKHRPERVLVTILAKLIFITITAKIIRMATALLWISSHREISYFRALRHFQTIAECWFSSIIKSFTASSYSLLKDAVHFIQENCYKIPQKEV